VRDGRIFCVSNQGSDANDGKFVSDPTGNGSGCWAFVSTAFKTRMTGGDTVYLGSAAGERFQTAAADRAHSTAVFLFSSSYPGIPKNCTKTKSCAIVGYPGATAIIGGEDGAVYGNIQYTLRNPGPYDYWTFANLHFLGATSSTVQAQTVLVERSHGWRVINNEVTMPSSSSAAAINADKLGTDDHQRDLFLYGNYVHKVSSRAPYNARKVHFIYLTCDANDVDIGWNHLDGSDSLNGACRGIHVHSSPFDGTRTDGFPQHGISIHDNLIEHIGCNGVDLTSGDPDEAKGGFWVYNNVFKDVGNGRGIWPDWPTCAPILTSMNVSSDYNWQYTTGTMHFVNNTIYDPGGSPCSAYPGQRGVFASQPLSHVWSTTCFHPQNPSTLCQTSGCDHARWQGSLTLDPSPSLGLWPGMNNFTARAGGTVAQQQIYDTGSSFKCNADLTPNELGADTCVELYQGGKRANGGGVSQGTLNLTTGTYDFAFEAIPAANSTVVYIVTQPFKIDFSNNIFYVKAGTSWYWPAESTLTEQRRIFTGTNNLFYSLQDSSPPANIPGLAPPFTANIGNNSDPLFISDSDFHLQPASIARSAGKTVSHVTHDHDAVVRPQEAKAAIGAFEFTQAAGKRTEPTLSLVLLAVIVLGLVTALILWRKKTRHGE
jgi:hypothetical protein